MRFSSAVCRSFGSISLALLLAAATVPRAAAVASGPTVAVLNFSTQWLTSDWYGNFEPGVALSDLLTDQLVNDGKFNVVDRKHLADIIVNHIDPSKFAAAAPSGPSARGRILTVDGDDIVINAGSDSGVTEGMMMDAISVKQLRDPDTGKYITSEIPKGVIQILSVTKSSAVGKRVSGTIKALEIVRSQ